MNLQDAFLNKVRREKLSITIFLLSGYELRGFVKGFDNYTIILESGGEEQLIYKHAISTLKTTDPMNLLEEEIND